MFALVSGSLAQDRRDSAGLSHSCHGLSALLDGGVRRVCSGVCHFEEVPYVFQVLGRLTGDGEAQLSHRMAAFWSQFAATGNPTPSGTAGETVAGWLGGWVSSVCRRVMQWEVLVRIVGNECVG